MTDFNNYKLLNTMVESLESVNTSTTNRVSSIRNLIGKINRTKERLLLGAITITEEELAEYQHVVDSAVNGKDIELLKNIETTHDIELFQLGVSTDSVNLDIIPNSLHAPEHGTILQKLWKVSFTDNSTGYVIFSDTSDEVLSSLVNAQLSTALATSPDGAVEDLNLTISVSDIKAAQESRDLSNLFTGFEKPGLVARQLRDINIDTDPELISLTDQQKTDIKSAVNILNSTNDENSTAQNQLQVAAEAVGLYSTSLGPTANVEYSDLKKFKLLKEDNTEIIVVASIPVVSWGSSVAGIPVRDGSSIKDKNNRKDSGTSYIIDLGGKDLVIRQGNPNPLPATRFYNNGPKGATEEEGALDRYGGGKCLGLNTTDEEVTFKALHRTGGGLIDIIIPPMSALWKLDRATFDGGNKHAYYTVFAAARPPPAGFMGCVFSPKQLRLGRGRGGAASGVTLANGISKTGKTFNKQDNNGAILENGVEVPSGLKGLTSAFDGHGMHPKDLLKFMQDNSFVKGTNYLTIPVDATIETVEDILIPAGEFVPQITQAVGTLFQFGNGNYISDGGPARFQPGLIPFLPGTQSYTPEWHINFIYYNTGRVECDNVEYLIDNPAIDTTPETWIKPNHNASFGPPGPKPVNSQESGFSPAFPDTFDPVQLRCNIKNTNNREYIDNIKGSKNGEIYLDMLPALERENKIFITEAPGGAMQFWVKWLVVNCPLPLVLTIKQIGEVVVSPPQTTPDVTGNCITCSCDRNATTVSINGDITPIWTDENDEEVDIAISDRVLKFKAGDNIVIRATSGTMHGVGFRSDNVTSNTSIDPNKTLEQMQGEVLTEIKEHFTINNELELEANIAAMTDDLINFHGGIPITFSQKATLNPIAFPDGTIIADFTVKEEAKGSSGKVSCTVHGASMSFLFEIC